MGKLLTASSSTCEPYTQKNGAEEAVPVSIGFAAERCLRYVTFYVYVTVYVTLRCAGEHYGAPGSQRNAWA